MWYILAMLNVSFILMSDQSFNDSPASGGNRLVRKTAVELVADEIRNRILSGKMAPGSQLRQEALAEELGVSRIPLREAFRLLSTEGLVELQPHRGSFVSMLSTADVEEVFEVRLQLEPWLLYEATSKITEAALAEAEQLVRDMDKADPADWGRLNWQLHETLYRAAEKPTALAMVKSLHDKSERYFRFQIVNAPIRKLAHDEHLQMISLCRQRRPRQASDALEQHIKDAASQILTIVEKIMSEAPAEPTTRNKAA